MSVRTGLFQIAAATPAALLFAAAAAVAAPAAGPGQPEKVSWYGDPKAPDISGVWVRVPTTDAKSSEGWTPFPPPLKGEFAGIWAKRVADETAGKRTDDPVRGCMPGGMPRFVTGMTTPMMILQTPGRVVMYRDGMPVRRIWVDGHPLPAAADLESFSNGNAIGHYEGKDLVTDVRGIRDQPIDSTGIPHSDDLRIVERYHRVSADTLKVDVTLIDSKAYRTPMKSTVIYKTFSDPSWEPREFICSPNKNYHPEIYVK